MTTETVTTTATTGAAPAPAAAAAMNAAARASMEAEDALAATLTPAQRPLYDALLEPQRDDEDAQVAWLLENLARHLPGLAPAIRALGYDHIRNSDDRDGTCCMERADAR